jgi:hypothetical protein
LVLAKLRALCDEEPRGLAGGLPDMTPGRIFLTARLVVTRQLTAQWASPGPALVACGQPGHGLRHLLPIKAT